MGMDFTHGVDMASYVAHFAICVHTCVHMCVFSLIHMGSLFVKMGA